MIGKSVMAAAVAALLGLSLFSVTSEARAQGRMIETPGRPGPGAPGLGPRPGSGPGPGLRPGPGWGPGPGPWVARPWGWGAYPWGFWGYPAYWNGSYPTFSEVDEMPCLRKVWLSKTRWTWRRLC
ncbi:hypothetical protein CCR97_04670 [Rhodoplanes elegans]|uniref:Sulfur globule protein n=1 Tax=Rhodoplanes elegans TaxID=29408 RepID=A0A327KHV2_9BRAD|nr:hypothetical protein [Rhodoplanes elegans]MBK5957504.1 hypothetical protein [Rhodoplanes elegans]RAI38349.1 hypothetical protein CH338_12955 [Rhodoplanes elegans]